MVDQRVIVADELIRWYDGAVVKILVSVLLAIVLGQTTGALSYVAERGCVDQCPEKQGGATCLPGCTACTCCGFPRSVLRPMLAHRPLVPLVGVVQHETRQIVSSAAVEEIFHVPKHPLV